MYVRLVSTAVILTVVLWMLSVVRSKLAAVVLVVDVTGVVLVLVGGSSTKSRNRVSVNNRMSLI